MKHRIVMAVLAIGLGADVLAAEEPDFAHISMVGASSGKPINDPSEFITLVIEGATLSHETASIPLTDAVVYVNNLLKTKNASYIGVYAREGAKYGDVLKAMDVLRHTTAKHIGISMNELPLGREL